jgi:hypothetical protein
MKAGRGDVVSKFARRWIQLPFFRFPLALLVSASASFFAEQETDKFNQSRGCFF